MLPFLRCLTAAAQEKSLDIRGALSISVPKDYSGTTYWQESYGDLDAPVGTQWMLLLGGADPNVTFAFCVSKDDWPGSCTPAFGRTDQYGNWKLTGAFDDSTVGQWSEWVQFPSGATSNRIVFTVSPGSGPIPVTGGVSLNGSSVGIFHVGQSWQLRVYGGYGDNYWYKPFDLCVETDGASVSCALSFGILDGNSSFLLSGTFSNADIGGRSLWVRFTPGTITKRIVYTVDDGPVDGESCTNGTIYPIGPDAGYTQFQRYQQDWSGDTGDSGDYSVMSNHTGGYGQTLEYLGCNGDNSIWLQWAYDSFLTLAARAPWSGQTDRGLHIGDTLARFQTLYPAAHRPFPAPNNQSPLWPSDLDVWDAGPLRVALRNGLIAMIQIDWWQTEGADGDDQASSTRTTIGPIDPSFAWH
jgi:hypothetical protein